MDQTECDLCPPNECICQYISTNSRYSKHRSSPSKVVLDGNPLNQRVSLKGSSPYRLHPPRPQNRRSPGFLGDHNFNQNNSNHQSIPNARIGSLKAFTSPQVNF